MFQKKVICKKAVSKGWCKKSTADIDLKKTKGGTRFDGILEENHHLNTFLKGKAPLRSFSGFY